jgi:hypothetical protein
MTKKRWIYRRQCPHCEQVVEYVADAEVYDRSKPVLTFTTRCANRRCNRPLELAEKHLVQIDV